MSRHQSKSDRPEPAGPTMEERAEQLNQLWAAHSEWGTPEDHAVVADRLELDGFKIMDEVRVTHDCESDGGIELEDGDEGVVVGTWHLPAGIFRSQPADGLLVWFEDTGLSDPMGMYADQLEHQ